MLTVESTSAAGMISACPWLALIAVAPQASVPGGDGAGGGGVGEGESLPPQLASSAASAPLPALANKSFLRVLSIVGPPYEATDATSQSSDLFHRCGCARGN